MIDLKVSVEDKEATGLYDPGANITMINYDFLQKIEKFVSIWKPYSFRTINGVGQMEGIAYLKMKIFNIEKKIRFFVIKKKDFKYDLLIGLDSIKAFQLCQDHNLKITQFNSNNNLNTFQENCNSDNEICINWNEFIPIEDFEVKTEHLEEEKKKQIFDLIDKYDSIFAKNKFDVGVVKEYEAHIELAENRYVAKRPYRCSFEDQKEIEFQIAELLKVGLI